MLSDPIQIQAIVAFFSLVELAQLYIFQSAATAIVMILCEAATNIYGVFYNACLIDMALGPVSRSVSQPRWYKRFIAVEKTILTFGLAVSILGILITESPEVKVRFQIAFFTTLMVDAVLVVGLQQYFLRKITSAIDEHLQAANRLSKNPVAEQAPLKQAREAVRLYLGLIPVLITHF